ncbi:MAG TPA: PP2C family protein-serine/threonine phosphatase [Terriglobales bacterium]|nr:PP2C family protein-serine/threonine phosphatase [Terriglobales bacterium]
MENAVQTRSSRRRIAAVHRVGVSARHSEAIALSEVTRRHGLEEQLAQLRGEHDDLRRALFEAAQAQRQLCGPRVLRRGPFEIATEIFPVRHLSGDFTSLFEADGDLIFAIGDIAGKGLPAGMWFTHLLGLVRLQFSSHGDPAATLAAVNRDLQRTSLGLPLASLFLGRLNPATGEITYCNAGHPPAFLLRANRKLEDLSTGGPLLGVLNAATYANGKAILHPGDTLLGYSDGITECRNAVGEDFSMERLLAAAQTACASGAAAILFSALGAVEDFAGSHPREDDFALIVVHRDAD